MTDLEEYFNNKRLISLEFFRVTVKLSKTEVVFWNAAQLVLPSAVGDGSCLLVLLLVDDAL